MKKQILFIEDYPVIQDLYAGALKKAGFEIDVVGDGEEGLDKVKQKEYDFILLDLLLPKTSGIEFLENYKKRPQKTHIIILSDFAYQQTVEKAYKLGVDNYWLKSENTPSQLTEKLLNYQGKDDKPPESTETGLA